MEDLIENSDKEELKNMERFIGNNVKEELINDKDEILISKSNTLNSERMDLEKEQEKENEKNKLDRLIDCKMNDINKSENTEIFSKIQDMSSSGSSTTSSSTSSSSSSSENTDSESDSDSDFANINNCRKTNNPRKKFLTNGETRPENLPKIEDINISVDSKHVELVGRVKHTVENIVVIESIKESKVLDLDTLLFVENGKRCLGKIDDVIGTVNHPNYCIRFNNKEHIEKFSLNVDQEVFYAPNEDYTKYVFLKQLMNEKGCDASWDDDNEPPEYHKDFSDDEEEKKALSQKGNMAQQKKNLNVNPDKPFYHRTPGRNRPLRARIHGHTSPRFRPNFPNNTNNMFSYQSNQAGYSHQQMPYNPQFPPRMHGNVNNNPNMVNNFHSGYNPMFSSFGPILPSNYMQYPPQMQYPHPMLQPSSTIPHSTYASHTPHPSFHQYPRPLTSTTPSPLPHPLPLTPNVANISAPIPPNMQFTPSKNSTYISPPMHNPYI